MRIGNSMIQTASSPTQTWVSRRRVVASAANAEPTAVPNERKPMTSCALASTAPEKHVPSSAEPPVLKSAAKIAPKPSAESRESAGRAGPGLLRRRISRGRVPAASRACCRRPREPPRIEAPIALRRARGGHGGRHDRAEIGDQHAAAARRAENRRRPTPGEQRFGGFVGYRLRERMVTGRRHRPDEGLLGDRPAPRGGRKTDGPVPAVPGRPRSGRKRSSSLLPSMATTRPASSSIAAIVVGALWSAIGFAANSTCNRVEKSTGSAKSSSRHGAPPWRLTNVAPTRSTVAPTAESRVRERPSSTTVSPAGSVTELRAPRAQEVGPPMGLEAVR